MTTKYYDRNELRKLFKYLKRNDKEMYGMAYLAVQYGLRISEVTQLKISDIDFEANRITFRRLKGSNLTEHPLTVEAKAILKHRIDFTYRNRFYHLHRSTIDRKLKETCRRLKLPREKAHFHTFKHTAAILLIKAGLDVRTIQATLGHKSLNSTLHYLSITGENIDRATIALDDILYYDE